AGRAVSRPTSRRAGADWPRSTPRPARCSQSQNERTRSEKTHANESSNRSSTRGGGKQVGGRRRSNRRDSRGRRLPGPPAAGPSRQGQLSGQAAKASGPVVSTAETSLGRILVDSRGRTLYLFEKDRKGKSACSGQCATFWPPLIAGAKPRVAGGGKASLISTTKRADGRLQVTYDHHPLYTFVKDMKKGQTKGEGVDAFGAEWYVISPAGNKVKKDSSSASSTGYSGP